MCSSDLQRRRRVFVVANARSWQRAAAVLFERDSLQGHLAPSRETGESVAGTIAARFGSSRNNMEEIAPPARTTFPMHGGMIGRQLQNGPTGSGFGDDGDPSYTLTSGDYLRHGVVAPMAFEPGSVARNAGPAGESPLAPTLRKEMGDNQPAIQIGRAHV